jgi:hypothetical protein
MSALIGWALVRYVFLLDTDTKDLIPFKETAMRCLVLLGWVFINGTLVKTWLCRTAKVYLQEAYIGHVEPLFPNSFRMGLKSLQLATLFTAFVSIFNFGKSAIC